MVQISQARILEWVVIPSPEDPPNPGIKPWSPALQAHSLPSELPGKLHLHLIKSNWRSWDSGLFLTWEPKITHLHSNRNYWLLCYLSSEGLSSQFRSIKSGVIFISIPSFKKAQAGIKIARRNNNNLRYADDTTLMAESKKELKSHLMKVKEESEKAGLKLNIQKTKIMASGPITSWQIDGETMETVRDFIFWGSQIIADGDRSHEIKRRLVLRRKAMTNLESILKSRDITLPTKVCLVKVMVFPIVTYGCWVGP